ncbi:hypothetical protein ScPMuIL_009382 [Solemya velum]
MAESTDTKRVVAIAVDESEHSEQAFRWYMDNIRRPDDFLLLIHCPETYDFTMASPGVVEQLLKELEERVNKLEQTYRAKLKGHGVVGKFRTGSGKPGETICSISKEENATMIITGTRGLGKFRRTIMGSVSDYVIHHSNVPVLVCRHMVAGS